MTAVYHVPLSQGADFNATYNWYSGGINRGIIQDIRVGYPTMIKATAHGLPSASDTPVIISDVAGEGVDELNSTDLKIHMAEYIDADYFYLPVNTYGKIWQPGTGVYTFHKPTDLTGFTARASIRLRWHDTSHIHQMTTENGGITLRTNDAAIMLYIAATTTAGFTFTKAYYDVELINPGGPVTRVIQGTITNSREMTK